MASPIKSPSSSEPERHHSASAIVVQPTSPRFPPTGTPTSGAQRRIGIAVDLSDESAFAVTWAVQNYLRPGDAVVLLHVRPTSVLYGADWGATDVSVPSDEASQQKLESDFDRFTVTKANDLARPLGEAKIPFKIHIVKDHDLKERLCLEVERLGLIAVIMGSRGFGATRRSSNARLGSVSDYCVHHCVCPVIVVRFSDDKDGDDDNAVKVHEEEPEFHDALDKANSLVFIGASLAGASYFQISTASWGSCFKYPKIRIRFVEKIEMVKPIRMFIKYSWFVCNHVIMLYGKVWQ